MHFKHLVFYILFLTGTTHVIAQHVYLPLNRDIHLGFEKEMNESGATIHSAIKPFMRTIHFHDKYRSISKGDSLFFAGKKKPQCWRTIFADHMVSVEKGGLVLTADPVFNFESGFDFWRRETSYVNTRGLILQGSIGKKFAFETSFYENQASFIAYLDHYVGDSLYIVPGQGRIHGFKVDGFDYSNATGYISLTPSKYFNFQFGHGKNFFGDGYRSMLLSDNAFSYPFLKISTSVWKLRYINLFTEFQDIRNRISYSSGYLRKYASFHYLSIEIGKKLQLGLFEGVVWQATDSVGKRGFELNYLNPVIFYHPIQTSLGHADNSMMGINVSFKLKKKHIWYGQAAFDDFNFAQFRNGSGFFQNKVAFQVGFKVFDVFNIKQLYFQTEYNQARPYMYAHKASEQNYAHLNQPLAHPLGANFRESVTFLKYGYKRWQIESKFIYAIYGEDADSAHNGRNIFRSDHDAGDIFSFGNYIGQGVHTISMTSDVKLSFLVNPATNMKLEVGYLLRDVTSVNREEVAYFVYFGFRTNLTNVYYDF